MNLETFFEKFDLFADAPDAVAKMRELVLELAVQGGLVPHLPDEAPVPYDSIEAATPINTIDTPSNWRVVLLADAIKNRSGNSKLIKGKLHEEPAPGRFQGFSASGADVWCDHFEHEGRAIIISAVGARCGKAFKAAGKWSAIANTNIARPEPTLFDFDFAYLVLNNEHFWVRGGSAQPFVKFPPSLDRYFALPPLAEQKRIVAKVDELMALCDRLEAQQQERESRHAALARASLARFADAPTPANLNFLFHPSYAIPPADLRKSILTLAVQGKLVPQDPDDEPAAKDGEDGTKASLREDSFPFGIPSLWTWKRLGDVALIERGGSPRPIKDYLTDDPDGLNWIKIGDTEIGGRYITSTREKIRKEGLSKTRKVYPGDFLLTNSMSFGRPYITKIEGCIHDGWLRIHPPEELGPEFLYYLLSSPFVNEFFSNAAAGAVVQNLNADKVRELVIPIPPLAEQRRIVAKVDELMALVDELEEQLAASRDTGAKLLAALVAELTAGKESHAAA